MLRANAVFEDVRRQLQEASGFLHAFTQGYRGFTTQDAVAGIARSSGLCEEMEKSFSTGPHAEEAGSAAASGRELIAGARARLNVLGAESR